MNVLGRRDGQNLGGYRTVLKRPHWVVCGVNGPLRPVKRSLWQNPGVWTGARVSGIMIA
jgi:hypothetical protein